MTPPRIGSLFSGAGGLDMAVEQVFGAETAWHCELDGAASKVLAHHWPDVANLGDITEIYSWNKVWMEQPVDILCGGYPCQPFSAAGQRKGTSDERHLWPYFAEAIRVLRPRFVVLENVAGHRSMGLSSVLADLAGIGYVGSWCSLRASDIGAPHRRERLFVVAHPNDGTRDREWTRPQSRQGSSATPIRSESVELLPTPVVTDAVGARNNTSGRQPGSKHHPGDTLNDVIHRGDLLPTPSTADGDGGHLSRSGDRSSELLLPGVARAYGNGDLLPTICAADANDNGGPGDLDKCDTLPSALKLLPTPAAADAARGPDLARADRDGSGGDDLHTFIYKTGRDAQWGKYAGAISRWEMATRTAPSPTEPNTKGNPRLAATFSEWLMGWPAGWVTQVPGISRNDQLRIIGNGVVPQQATAALTWLLNVQAAA